MCMMGTYISYTHTHIYVYMIYIHVYTYMKYFLSIVAILKNETTNLGEWLEHYLSERRRPLLFN